MSFLISQLGSGAGRFYDDDDETKYSREYQVVRAIVCVCVMAQKEGSLAKLLSRLKEESEKDIPHCAVLQCSAVPYRSLSTLLCTANAYFRGSVDYLVRR